MKKNIISICFIFCVLLTNSQINQKQIKIDFKKEIKPLLDVADIQKAIPIINKYFNQNLIIGNIWHPKVILFESNNMFYSEKLLANYYDEKAINNLSIVYADSALFWYKRMLFDSHADSLNAKKRVLYFSNAANEFENIKLEKIRLQNQKEEEIRKKKEEEVRKEEETRLKKLEIELQKKEEEKRKKKEEEVRKEEETRLKKQEIESQKKEEEYRKINEMVDQNNKNNEFEEGSFQGEEEHKIILGSGEICRYINDVGDIVTVDCNLKDEIMMRNSLKYRHVVFVMGNPICGKVHLLTNKIISSEDRRSSSINQLYRLAKIKSFNDGRIADLPTKNDVNKTLAIEIQERFILFRKKNGKNCCPICNPLSDFENSLGNSDDQSYIKPVVLEVQNNKYGEVVDIDGNKYKTIKIGNQTWFAENLKVETYNNGEKIVNYNDIFKGSNIDFQWSWLDQTKGFWCYFENNTDNNMKYGKLYNGYVLKNTNNVCPQGWKVPTNKDFSDLIKYLGENPDQKLKQEGNLSWINNSKSTNLSLFTALPAGLINNNGFVGDGAYFWTSTEASSSWDSIQFMGLDLTSYGEDRYQQRSHLVNEGLSIRCIKE